jgi:hypothetical protein
MLRIVTAQFAIQPPTLPADARPTGGEDSPVRSKRSTARGDARAKIISALTEHHRYASGGVLNLEPIGVNELVRRLRNGRNSGVGIASVSRFFTKEFNGHARYCGLYCGDSRRLTAALKNLNGEYTVDHLLGGEPRQAKQD